jgi:hypothetical protein
MNSVVAEKQYISSKLGVPYENLSQSYLRSETILGNQSTIEFILQSNKKVTPEVTERLLDLNDEFIVTHFTVGFLTAGPTDANHVVANIQTYESTGLVASPALAAVYNSDLSWTIDRKVYVPQFPVRGFRRVPQAQTTDAVITVGQNGYETGLYGFYNSEPTLIDGRQTMEVLINLGSTIDLASPTESTETYAVFEARGYLITNAKS